MSADPHVNGEYLRHNRDWHVHTSAWKARQIMKMVNRHHLKPKTVGDVGCGAGEVLRQMQLQMDPECEFYGYDISPQAISMSRERANDRLQFEVANICETETPYFDLMLVLEVVDHVEDYLGFLRALKKKSDLKLFHFSLDLSVQNAIRKNSYKTLRDTLVHLHYFNKETMLRTLQDTGYEVIDCFYTPFAMNFSSETRGKLVRPLRWLLYQVDQDLAVRLLGGYRLMVLAR
jgi:trans-aconitate methyltransferase